MSIATELTLLANSKQAIKDSINAKGGSITENTPFADYSTAIDNLPSGGSGNKVLDSIDVNNFSGTTFDDARSYITDVTIPSGVTSISNEALRNSTSLTSVTIPNSVTSLGSGAFFNCTNLTTVNIPSGVTYIQQQTFGQCYKLESITLPNNLAIIGVNAFFACQKLKTITLPATISSIGRNAFSNCTALESIVSLKTTPPTLATGVFNNTNNCPIYVPSASVAAYKAESNWSTYENRIFGFEQVATVDGNPVYSFDLGMTDMTDISSQQLAAIPSGDVIEICEGISTIWGQFGAYEEITLPSTITVLYDADSIGASTTTLTCKSTTPPTVQQDSIGGANLTAIYVPASAVSTYQSNPAFSSFSSIIQAIPS